MKRRLSEMAAALAAVEACDEEGSDDEACDDDDEARRAGEPLGLAIVRLVKVREYEKERARLWISA